MTVVRFIAWAILCVPQSGCLATKVVTMPVKLAATTVLVVGETAETIVKTTGRVTRAAVGTGGGLTADGIESAGKLARSGMVTFVDAADGSVVRVPWQHGLTLAGASDVAKVRALQRAVQLVRAGRLIKRATDAPASSLLLEGGDVVRLLK